MNKDYYSVLGVSKSAGQEEIKKAFRKKAHEYHPDKKGGDEAKFKEANEAYQVLGNAQKRKQYDQFGSADFSSQGGFGGAGFGGFGGGANGYQNVNIDMDDLGDMFGGLGDIFGFGGGGARRREPRRGSDIQAVMTISFTEAVFGAEKDIDLRKTVVCETCKGSGAKPGAKIDTCKTCSGSGRVIKLQRTILGSMQVETTCSDCNGEGKTYSEKCPNCRGVGIENKNIKLKVRIPAGISEGESIRLTGQGEAGEKGAQMGDLYIRVRVATQSKFERVGYDIKNKKEISISEATLGAKVDIETIHGKVSLKVPEGTQGGTVFKLKGKGVNRLDGRGMGDHLVEIIVKIPKNLNKKQKDLLKEIGI